MKGRILPTSKWKKWIEGIDSEKVYEQDTETFVYFNSHKKELLLSLLTLYEKYFGEEEVQILRIPARVNLMGMHIEHRGGFVNHICLPCETVMVVSKGEEGWFKACNLNKAYPPRSFYIPDFFPLLDAYSWEKFIEKVNIKKGDWGNYLLGGILRLAKEFPSQRRQGVKLAIGGDIPLNAGLSSSSTLVVGATLAFCQMNGIPFSVERLTELCGEGEWLVGTRGGAGDHGAMLLGREDNILHLRFFPLYYEYIPFPEEYAVLVTHSGVSAEKAKGAKDIFNQRVATYDLALMWLKKVFPEWKDKILWVRDINPQNLGIKEEDIYSLLKSLPLRITRSQMKKEFPKERKFLDRVFSTHKEPREGYALRDVLLYGISECRRAEVVFSLAQKKDWKRIGELMYIAHDGDRVIGYQKGEAGVGGQETTDEYLDRLIRERRRLEEVPGGYRCSVPELDIMVDLMKELPFVIGARLTGAGLGGSMVVLVKRGKEEEVKRVLQEKYYSPRNLKPLIVEGIPISGASFM